MALSHNQSPDRMGCLGLVLDENLGFWGTYSVDRDHSIEIDRNCASLANLLSQRPRLLSRRDSLSLATNLASSLLQLHATPWLSENWCNESIYFSCPDKIRDPYVRAHIGDSSHSMANTAHSFAFNPYLVALGIILLELSERKSFLEWTHENGIECDSDDVIDKAMAAFKWFGQSYGNMSEDYAIAVQHCLNSSFTPVQPNTTLADPGFRHAVYRDIVQRLEKEYFKFTTHIRVSGS